MVKKNHKCSEAVLRKFPGNFLRQVDVVLI